MPDSDALPFAGSGPTRLLLVDDDDVDREHIRRLVKRAWPQCELVEADSAQDLMRVMPAEPVDCILLDYRLPGYDGLELLELLRKRPIAEGAGAIVLTRAGSEQIATECLKRGADDYLVKQDLDGESLCTAVRRAIELARKAQEKAERQREIERLSFYDSLTGLPNRNLYLDRLDQAVHKAQRDGGGFALLVMDLNGFKEINDSLGHEAGDRLLQVVGQRLADICRESDTIARLGGDEFAAILTTTPGRDGALTAAAKITECIATPILLEEKEVEVGVSIGIALCPDQGRDSRTLFRLSDQAMYRAKRAGTGIELHSPRAELSSEPRKPDPAELERAIASGKLLLHYQPKVALGSGRLVGAEALVRWQHPTRGLLSPAAFLATAESASLIRPLTLFVLDRALTDSAGWRSAAAPDGLPISVNLSARLLEEESLLPEIDRLLERHGSAPGRLTLEITEQGVMSNSEAARRMLGALMARGLRVSIDDFGAGYKALRRLLDLPMSEIKVDPGFVRNAIDGPAEAAVIASIVSIGRDLDLTVVAEGVEDGETSSHLEALGCDQAQGWHFGHPLPRDGFEAAHLTLQPGWRQFPHSA